MEMDNAVAEQIDLILINFLLLCNKFNFSFIEI